MNLIAAICRVVGGFAVQLGVTLVLLLFYRDIIHPIGGLAEALASLGMVMIWFTTFIALAVILSKTE